MKAKGAEKEEEEDDDDDEQSYFFELAKSHDSIDATRARPLSVVQGSPSLCCSTTAT